MNPPLISIIIPVYNTEQCLPKCLDSAVSQSFKDIEIIVVDDGSPGNCKDICASYPVAKYYAYGKNRGLFSAREYGVRQARGSYIINLDSDDWLPLDACAHIAKAISETDADIYMHASKRFLPKNTLYRPPLEAALPLFNFFIKKQKYTHVFLWQLVIKRDILLTVYNDLQVRERLILSEDILHVYPCLYYAQSWGTIPEVCYCYNESNTSATRKEPTTENVLEDLNYIRILFAHLEAFRKSKGLSDGIFESIKRHQFMDRMGEMKKGYANIDWEKVFPILLEVFGPQYISSSLFEIIYSPSMKFPVRSLVAQLIKLQHRILPEGSWIFNVLQSFWWKTRE